MTYRIIQKRKFFLVFSGILVAASIYALATFGLNFGIDFTGGSLLEVEYANHQPTIAEVQDSLKDLELSNLIIQPTEDSSVIIRFKETSEATHQLMIEGMEAGIEGIEGASLKELRFDSVGPSIGQELKSKSFNASIIVLIMIIIYISLTFKKVSRPVASWKYGLTAIIALVPMY